MKLRAIRLWNVRKFAGRGIALENIGDGVNVLSEENETGKTSTFDAVHALFFLPYSGTPKLVQMLRPYSGGSPQIEVDVETDQGLFRINKQYYSGRRARVSDLATGRIVAQGDEAEAWIADLVRGGSSGPAGLLWVEQGTTDLTGRSQRERQDERKAREDVLTSVTGDEVELLTGGRRMVRVFEQTLSKLDEMITSTAKARAGGPYAQALEELADLRVKEENLTDKKQQLHSALNSRRKKRLRLAQLDDPQSVARRQRDKENAAQLLAKAQADIARLLNAEALEKIATQNHSAATIKLEDYRGKLKRAEHLANKLTDDEATYDATLVQRDGASTLDQQSHMTLEQAEDDLERLQNELDSARAAQATMQAASQLTELKQRLDKAQTFRNELDKLKAEANIISITDDDISSLEQHEQQIALLAARMRTKAVSVRIDYFSGDGQKQFNHDNRPVPGGQDIQIFFTRVFDITDIGKLTISPGSDKSAEELRTELRAAEKQLQHELAALDVETVVAAKKQLALSIQEASAISNGQTKLDIMAPEGLDALRQSVFALEAKVDSIVSHAIDIDGAQAKLQRAMKTRLEARTQREFARATLQDTRDRFSRADETFITSRKDLAQMDENLGPASQRNTLHKSLRDAWQTAGEELDGMKRDAALLRENAPELENIKAAAARASSVVERVETERVALEKEIGELNVHITISSEHGIEEEYEHIKGRRQAANARVLVFQHEIKVLQRLKKVLDEARLAAREQYFEPVMTELRPLLTLLVEEASITFDDETLLPQTLARNGIDEDVGVLSGGTREQIAILTRLAFARLLAKGGDGVPVILDDALVYSDDNRIERMFEALHRQASDLQILVFTCRQRAFEKLGGNGLRIVEWEPQN